MSYIKDKQKNYKAMQIATRTEQLRAQCISIKAENDQMEIERRRNLEEAGINPDASSPPKSKNWFVRHRYLVVILITVGLILAMAAIKSFTVNH